MFELLLTVVIVSNCGNSDFKTREYYTKHVRQKADKEFMKRWENDLNKEGGRTKSFA